MKTKTTVIISIILILATLLAGALLWNRLPEQMASHWNEQDQVDGYMSRFWGIFLLPLMTIGLTLLFFAIPSIDPLKSNIAGFRGTFNLFILFFLVFMLFVHGLTLAWNLGYTGFKFSSALLPALGLLFILTGFMIRKAKRNYFIGIRTPWTLANEVVWDKTHALGSKLFIAAGMLTFLGVFVPQKAFPILMVSILGATLITVVYSFIVFKQEEQKTR